MTKDKALDLALKVMQINLTLLKKINPYKGQEDLLSDSLDLTHKAITAIKQALAAPVQPVALEEYDAGLLNDYGGGNVEWWQDYIRAELGRAYEHYQSQMATPPAQPAPVQPVWIQPDHLQKAQKAPFLCRVEPHKREDFIPLYTTPPEAQRQWVGLSEEEILKLAYPIRWQEVDDFEADRAVNFAQMVEAKLKEKNT